MVIPDKTLTCWNCAAALVDIPLPLGARAQCRACRASLPACRMCIFFDRTVSKQCREPVAEEVQDKTRSNFCRYLQPTPRAFSAKDTGKAQAAQSELDALFELPATADNDSPSDPDAARQQLDQLFGLDKK